MKAFLAIVAASLIAVGCFTCGYSLALAQKDSQRAALMRNCTAQWEDGLASTVHTQTGDIEICIAGSHQMEKFQ
jgi:hypothetical protein